MTDIQRQLVEGPPGKVVFLGGAGSGKSTLIVERTVWLLSSGMARPEEILVLTPSRRAATVLSDRLRDRLEGRPAPTATSFHGLALTILRRYYREMGYLQAPQILDTAQHFHLLHQMLLEEDPALWPHYHGSLGTSTLRSLAYDVVLGAAEHRLNQPELLRQAQRWGRPDLAELVSFYARYRESQRQEGLIDFGELLAGATTLLATNPGIAGLYHRAYRHILVDEFEDANHTQAEMLFRLTNGETDLLMAGGADEAINGYRGGSARYLLESAERFGARVVRSAEQPASAGRIAALQVNVQSSGVGAVLPLEEGRGASPPRPGNPAPTPKSEQIPLRPGSSSPDRQEGTPSEDDGWVELHPFTYPSDEARWVAEEVQRLVGSGLAPSRIAVLSRSLAGPLPKLIAAELARRGIPSAGLAVRQVPGEPLIQATVNLLRYLAGGKDSHKAFVDLLRSPLAGLPPFAGQELWRVAALAKIDLARLATDRSQLDELAIGDEIRAAITAHLNRLEAMRSKLQWSPASLLWEIWLTFPAFKEDALTGGRGAAAYATFLAQIANWQEQRPSSGIPDLLRLMDDRYFDPVSVPPPSRRGVTLSTVHQAKGQQWEAVFLPGLVEESFPLRLSSLDVVQHLLDRDPSVDAETGPLPARDDFEARRLARHLAEEKRVFGVATSRACRRLYLSYSRRTADGGSAALPSRFLGPVSACPAVDCGMHLDSLPSDLAGSVSYYRQRLAAADPLVQAQALCALDEMQQIWPEAVQPAEWWANVRETEGASPVFPAGRLYLSATQLSSYRDCPLAYQFGHHWRLLDLEGPALTMGSLVHTVLEEYHRPGSSLPRTRAALEELLERHFDASAFPYRPIARQARKAIGVLLDAYFNRYGQSSSIIGVEKRIEFAFGPHEIRGFIDRIDRMASGDLELIDYKTGSAMSKDEAQDDLQLALYDLAFDESRDLGHLGRSAKVSYLYLKNIGPRADGKRSYEPTEESRDHLRRQIAYYAGCILAELFPSRFSLAEVLPNLDPAERERARKKNPCQFCSYEWICPDLERGGGEA